MSKQKLEKIVTPKGIAVYPKLRKADYKFKENGEYGTKVLFERSDVEALITKLTAIHEQAYKDAVADLLEDGKAKMIDGQVALLKDGKPQKDKGKLKVFEPMSLPYSEELDEEGNETGKVMMNFKSGATYKDKKSGEMKALSPPTLVDAKGKILPKEVDVWGGSVIKVSAEINPFATALGAGVSLRLNGVQVIELRSGGDRDAASLGFGEEDGYEADAAPAGDFKDETTADDSDATDTPNF